VFHLVVAAALLVHVVLAAAATVSGFRGERWLVRPAVGLLVLMCVQLGLGAATWVTKYGWPSWLGGFDWAAGYVVLADSRPQAWITTAHVAAGSLILVTSLLLALRAARLARREPLAPAQVKPGLWMETAR
jgi:cytochrome c oxidase assembly protein subunit 15